jgi:hypothetical protein
VLGYAYAVIDGSGRVLFSSGRDEAPIFPHDLRSSKVAFLETRQGKAAISGVSMAKDMGDGKHMGDGTVWVQVAEDLAHRDVIIDDIVADFFKRVGWITLPILLFLLAIDIAIFRRALRPLHKASEMAKEITPRRTDVRLSPQSIPSEILPLVQAINQALDRLEAGFRVQREFTADAAHELRTPLTILRGRVDALVDRSIAKALHKDIEGMARIVSQLLDIAELETLAIDPAEKADLRAICAEVAELAAPLRDELLQTLEQWARRLTRAQRQRIDRDAQGLDLLSSRFAHAMATLRPHKQRLDLLAHRSRAALTQRLRSAEQSLAHAAAHWQRAAAAGLERRAARLTGLADRLALLDPQQVLSRGYALIESEAGRVVVAPSQLRAGERLTVSLAQGQAELVPREVRQREG